MERGRQETDGARLPTQSPGCNASVRFWFVFETEALQSSFIHRIDTEMPTSAYSKRRPSVLKTI